MDIFRYIPAGASTKSVIHASQLMKTTRFQQFDYGIFGNLDKYRRFTPPTYSLSKVTAKVAIWYGDNDWLSSTIDVDRLRRELPSVIKNLIPIRWAHLDFVWGVDAKALLYNPIVATMRANEA